MNTFGKAWKLYATIANMLLLKGFDAAPGKRQNISSFSSGSDEPPHTNNAPHLIEIDPSGCWYHGSNKLFTELREGSTVTQWRSLAEAFSHKPSVLGYDDNGEIVHNGTEYGYLYVIDEDLIVDKDIYQHPRTTMDQNVEFLTKRPLKVRLIAELPVNT
ncbi:MAG TPA: hypothetical protein H9664_00990 [Firmicutes bacterium]|nr:hypothetical protein [Bacillota bacterium]